MFSVAFEKKISENLKFLNLEYKFLFVFIIFRKKSIILNEEKMKNFRSLKYFLLSVFLFVENYETTTLNHFYTKRIF